MVHLVRLYVCAATTRDRNACRPLPNHDLPLPAPAPCHALFWQAATYNVNGRPPPEGTDLSPWLGGARFADIVAVGFQASMGGEGGAC